MIRTSGRALGAAALLWWALALAAQSPPETGGGLALLMFDAPDCSYCAQWEREVGVIYARTAEGRAAPLIRSALGDSAMAGVVLQAPVHVAPTFILHRDGRELGRITGYPGEAHFWGLLGELLQRANSG